MNEQESIKQMFGEDLTDLQRQAIADLLEKGRIDVDRYYLDWVYESSSAALEIQHRVDYLSKHIGEENLDL